MCPWADIAPWVPGLVKGAWAGFQFLLTSLVEYLCAVQNSHRSVSSLLLSPLHTWELDSNNLGRKLSINIQRHGRCVSACSMAGLSQAFYHMGLVTLTPCITMAVDLTMRAYLGQRQSLGLGMILNWVPPKNVIFLWKHLLLILMQKRDQRNKTTQTICHFLGADRIPVSRWGHPELGGWGENTTDRSPSFMPTEVLGKRGWGRGPS